MCVYTCILVYISLHKVLQSTKCIPVNVGLYVQKDDSHRPLRFLLKTTRKLSNVKTKCEHVHTHKLSLNRRISCSLTHVLAFSKDTNKPPCHATRALFDKGETRLQALLKTPSTRYAQVDLCAHLATTATFPLCPSSVNVCCPRCRP